MSNTCPKIFVIACMNWVAISCGFTYGHTAGLARALQRKEDGMTISESEISFIASALNFSVIIGLILLAIVGDKLGRRWCFIIFSIPMVVNWIILYNARNFALIMLTRLLAGLSTGALSILNLVVTAEFTSPNSRGIFLSMISMGAPALGTGLGHVLGVLFHWRTLALVGAVSSTIHVLLPYFWVESPHWLASKNRFEDCKHSFRKLHGDNETCEQELRQLIRMESSKLETSNDSTTFQLLMAAFKKRYFWNLLLMSGISNVYYAAAGKSIFSVLATVVLEEMTGSSNVLVYTLLIDGCVLLGTCGSCILIKKLSIRILLFSSGLVANGILIVLSACLYFKNSEIYFQWINVILLSLYFVMIHAGPYPIIEILYGEMFPLELKLYCFFLSTPVMITTLCSSIILLPYFVSALGYHGFFLMNAAIMFLCLGYFWCRLPETKGKTLQEIEVYFKTNNFNVDEVLNNEQKKTLI